MRKLQTKDIFQAIRLIVKSNLKEELRPVLAKASDSEMSVRDIGVDGILTVMEVLVEKKCENAFYEFLAGPFESTPEEVEELGLCELAEQLERLAEENDLRGFFTQLGGLITKKSLTSCGADITV